MISRFQTPAAPAENPTRCLTGGPLPKGQEADAVAAMVADLRAGFFEGRCAVSHAVNERGWLSIETVPGPDVLSVDAVRDALKAERRAA